MTSPLTHWDAVVCILRYLKSASSRVPLFEDIRYKDIIGYKDVKCARSPSNGPITSEYCVLVKVILCSGKVRNKVWVLDLVQKKNIKQ